MQSLEVLLLQQVGFVSVLLAYLVLLARLDL